MSDEKTPKLSPSMLGWIRKHTAENYWRVAGWYEFDDLLQDGYLAAHKCLLRYPDVEDKHLMALIKTSFYRVITDLLRQKYPDTYYQVPLMSMKNKRGRGREATSETEVLEWLGSNNLLDMPVAEFNVFISQLPEWVQKTLALLSTPEGVKKLYRYRVKLDGPTETFEDRLRKLTGMPANVQDFEAELIAYLSA